MTGRAGRPVRSVRRAFAVLAVLAAPGAGRCRRLLAAGLLAGCAAGGPAGVPPARVTPSATDSGATREDPSDVRAEVPEPPGAEGLAWLAGRWLMATPNGQVEELWLPPAGGSLYGVGRTVSDGVTRFFEFLAIVTREDGSLAFVARPRGGAPVEFPLVERSARHVVFANPGHDFPRRILYELLPDGRLHARVDDGRDLGEGEDFSYSPAPRR